MALLRLEARKVSRALRAVRGAQDGEAVKIVLEGMPRAWSRPRKGRYGRAATVGYGSVRATKQLNDLVRAMQAAKSEFAELENFPLDGPVSCTIDFDFAGAGQTRISVLPVALTGLSTRRTDLDNLCKLVFEALQHAGILRDDAQIASVTARKLR